MALRSIPTVNASDDILNRIQDNLIRGIQDLQKQPLNSGSLLTGVALANGDTTIRHGLGHKLTGWVVVRRRAAATIYDKQDANTIPESTLVLNSSAAVTVDLFVF